MTDILIIIAIIAIFIIDRYFFVKQQHKQTEKLLEDNSRLVKAVMAKNANDYVMTTSIDKVPTEETPQREPDEVPEETLSDDDFFKAIKKGNKE